VRRRRCCASRSLNGTLVPTPDVPPDDMLPSLLATSDVLVPAGLPPTLPSEARHDRRVVGDGAVGLLAFSRRGRWAPRGSSP